MSQEKVIRFSNNKILNGVLTLPEKENSTAPCCIFLNAGLIHRVGPNRLWVSLARHLASFGIYSARFDLSALGDSLPRRDGLPYHQSRVQETKELLDYLQEKYQQKRFVLIGLCSGADHGFRVACEDKRIAGVVMLDGYAYRTPRYYWEHYSKRFLSADVWKRFLGRLFSTSKSSANGEQTEEQTDIERFVMDVPPKETANQQLKTLLDRNTKLFMVYTKSMEAVYNYKEQITDMLPSASNPSVTCHYWPDTDHTFTLLSHQGRLKSSLSSWLEQSLVKEMDNS